MKDDTDPERTAFLLTIKTNPEDRNAQLVFADWLEERGEITFAALIRKGTITPESFNNFKCFTEKDVIRSLSTSSDSGTYWRIQADHSNLLYDPPKWMQQGLQETASGYGRKLNSGYKISYCGKLYRVYITIFSNSGSSWFVAKGQKIFVG